MFAIICQVILKFVSSHQHLFVAAAVFDAVVVVVVVVIIIIIMILVVIRYFLNRIEKRDFVLLNYNPIIILIYYCNFLWEHFITLSFL